MLVKDNVKWENKIYRIIHTLGSQPYKKYKYEEYKYKYEICQVRIVIELAELVCCDYELFSIFCFLHCNYNAFII